MTKYPQTWVETPIFDAGTVAKRASDQTRMAGLIPKTRDDADATAVAVFLANRVVTRPTAEEQRACDVRANKRGQGRKDIEKVAKGWASHRAARAAPSKAEIMAMEAKAETWSVSPSSLKERGDTKVSFPNTNEVPEYVFKPNAAPIVIPGRCANVDCGNPIPPKMLEKGAKCCCKNCTQTVRRRRNAKIMADRMFVPIKPAAGPATRPTVYHDLTPEEYFNDMKADAAAHAEWDTQAAKDVAEAKREAEIDAVLEALSKRVPKPVVTRRLTPQN